MADEISSKIVGVATIIDFVKKSPPRSKNLDERSEDFSTHEQSTLESIKSKNIMERSPPRINKGVEKSLIFDTPISSKTKNRSRDWSSPFWDSPKFPENSGYEKKNHTIPKKEFPSSIFKEEEEELEKQKYDQIIDDIPPFDNGLILEVDQIDIDSSSQILNYWLSKSNIFMSSFLKQYYIKQLQKNGLLGNENQKILCDDNKERNLYSAAQFYIILENLSNNEIWKKSDKKIETPKSILFCAKDEDIEEGNSIIYCKHSYIEFLDILNDFSKF
jgi:hypothetical protein